VGGLLLFAIAVALAGVLGYTVYRPLPVTAGNLTVPGLRARVEVLRDANGIPHLYAANEHDLFFAQGYVHAQDRFFQMDFWRHVTAGRLAEMFGPGTLSEDRFLRTVGWQRVAAQEYAQASPEVRAVLDAYAAGVNAYIADRAPADLSVEYAILAATGYAPERVEAWTPVHSLAWAKAMAWDLGSNLNDELIGARLVALLGPERAAELMPEPPADNPVILPEFVYPSGEAAGGGGPMARSLSQPGLALQRGGSLDSGIGSNNWTLAGSRTETGAPILANDPHLGPQMPALWYLIGLHCQPVTADCPYQVAGYSLPGDPGVIIGFNNRIAWGVTNNYPDVQDVVIERLNASSPDRYEVEGEFVPFEEVRQEQLGVLGRAPESLTVRVTRHGPLIHDPLVYEDAAMLISETVTIGDVTLGPEYGLALRWTALQPGTLFESVLALNRAQTFDQFRDALRLWDVPSQNFVYADVDGNIGYQMPGRVPIRTGYDGTLPVPGWDGQQTWTGFVPFDDLPYQLNPARGYVITANQPVVAGPTPYAITGNAADMGYRGARITALIEADPLLSVDDVARIQADNYNSNAEVMLPYVLALEVDDPAVRAAQQQLASWDRQMQRDSAPAAIYASLYRALVRAMFDETLPPDLWPSGGDNTWAMLAQLLPQPENAWWGPAGRDEALRAALTAGVAYLRDRLGDDPNEWRWGRLHQTVLRNRTLGRSGVAPIEALLNRGPYATSGGSSIVNATSFNLACEGRTPVPCSNPFEVTNLPSMRMIVDLSDLDNTRVIHTTGQSGHTASRHYADMAGPWAAIEFLRMPFSRAAVEAATTDRLYLNP
jgi:penicillin amidase